MAGVFAELLKKNASGGSIPSRMSEARTWVQTKATSLMKSPAAVISQAPSSKLKSTPGGSIGSMVLFQYTATTAKDLPYWDAFPLVFPFNVDSTGMYGINMHYLPLGMRASLMDSLWKLASGPATDEKTRLNLSYSILRSAASNQYFKPCVKHYLNTGLTSNLVSIPAAEWNVALFLPLERFRKASTSQVHQDSRRIIRGR